MKAKPPSLVDSNPSPLRGTLGVSNPTTAYDMQQNQSFSIHLLLFSFFFMWHALLTLESIDRLRCVGKLI